ncbi:MAG: 3'(2'),5'-bisphosphate nucleotidase CysQ [Pseudobdellovibrionaceae bacterium]|jgi:3'(2'),5'-bisphosphate nucleotidase|nr:3'(2'),5'-bisphosphate nucleotidase CysQ [Pseudobdellovibrionaceae bacterium]
MIDISLLPLNDWAQKCLEIADCAGREIMSVYAKNEFEKCLKADKSPVTEADIKANRIIVDALAELTPNIVIISEEEAEKQEGHDIFWLVDPLDGTREFIKRNGEFTVNIALVVDRIPVLGIITAPALDLAFVGGMGMPPRKRDAQGVWSTIHVDHAPKIVKIAGSKSHGSDLSKNWIEVHYPQAEVVGVGSSLKFCMIAEGQAHFYPRFGPTMEWDTAAGHAILNAAGGAVVLTDGAPFFYGKSGFLNPHFIARHFK